MQSETGLQCHSQSCWIGNQKIQSAAMRTYISQLSSSNPDRGILFYLPLDSDYSCAITVDIVPIMHCCINSSAERLPQWPTFDGQSRAVLLPTFRGSPDTTWPEVM